MYGFVRYPRVRKLQTLNKRAHSAAKMGMSNVAPAHTGPAIASVFTAQGECVRPDRTKIFHALGVHRLATYAALPDNGAT